MRLFSPIALSFLLCPVLFGPGTGHWALGTGQDFTTTAEGKQIILLIRSQWVAIMPYDGKDHLYFTTPMVDRCGRAHIQIN